MEQNRTIHELLQLMLDNQHMFIKGLCHWAIIMYHYDIFTKNEYSLLFEFINDNKPNNFNTRIEIHGRYYWKKGNIEPRLRWIKKYIQKTKP